MGITSEAFQEYYIETPHGREWARSMLTSLWSFRLLYGVCRHDYHGRGEIVDGGPLLGVGTYAMARGLDHNSLVVNKHKRIYSFDLWLASPDMGGYVDREGQATGSVLERFLEIYRDYLDTIYVSPGDLLAMRWPSRPIEVLLFVDIAKSPDLNALVTSELVHLPDSRSIDPDPAGLRSFRRVVDCCDDGIFQGMFRTDRICLWRVRCLSLC